MNIKIKFSLLLLLVLGISCEEYLSENPPTFISASNYWKTEGDARTAVDGVYNQLALNYNRYAAGIDIYTDDLVSRTQGSSFNDFGLHVLSPSNSMLENTPLYKGNWIGIGRANNVIEYVPSIEMDQTEKNAILGEARALRAFFYFQLVRIFGDMPIILNAITTEEDFMKPRESVDDVYNEIIIPDLKFAEEFCKDELHDGHISKWTAKMILADVYLTRAGYRMTSQGEKIQGDPSNWVLARDKAKEIIDESPHSLNINAAANGTPAYGVNWDVSSVFTKESIFEIAYLPVLGYGNWMSRECNGAATGSNYWGANGNRPLEDEGVTTTVSEMRFPGRPPGVGIYIPTPDIYDAFEDGDERRDWSLMTRYDVSDTEVYVCQPIFRKYVDFDYFLGLDGTSFQYANANAILYRFADALLIYAEAQNEAEGNPNSDAYLALNAIRNRAGLASLSGLSQEEFRNAVWQERRVEFNAEFKRKFDLIRTDRLVQETSNINVIWSPDQGSINTYRNCYAQFTGTAPWPDNEWLWPIPQSEMELNVDNNWVQNEGY